MLERMVRASILSAAAFAHARTAAVGLRQFVATCRG
jgi:hypothetical protein